MIAQTIRELGLTANDNTLRYVEAYMRVQYGTLDALGGHEWDREVKIGLECAAHVSHEDNEQLAKSFGL